MLDSIMINFTIHYMPHPKIQCLSQKAGLSILFMVVHRFGWELEKAKGLRIALVDLLSNCKCIQ